MRCREPPLQPQRISVTELNVQECRENPRTCQVSEEMWSRLLKVLLLIKGLMLLFFIKCALQAVCFRFLFLLILFQLPQRSSISKRSFRMKSFWRSSPTCWSRTCVRLPAYASDSVSLQMTPFSGEFLHTDNRLIYRSHFHCGSMVENVKGSVML